MKTNKPKKLKLTNRYCMEMVELKLPLSSVAKLMDVYEKDIYQEVYERICLGLGGSTEEGEARFAKRMIKNLIYQLSRQRVSGKLRQGKKVFKKMSKEYLWDQAWKDLENHIKERQKRAKNPPLIEIKINVKSKISRWYRKLKHKKP